MIRSKHLERIILAQGACFCYIDRYVTDGRESVYLCINEREEPGLKVDLSLDTEENDYAFRSSELTPDDCERLFEILRREYTGGDYAECLASFVAAYFSGNGQGVAVGSLFEVLLELFQAADVEWSPSKTSLRDYFYYRRNYTVPVFGESTHAEAAYYEIFMNFVEEFQMGGSTSISVIRLSPSEYIIEDDGGGIPLGYDERYGTEVCDLLFRYPDGYEPPCAPDCEEDALTRNHKLGTLAFYRTLPPYPYNIRTRGVRGSCEALNAVSEFLEVSSVHGGKALSVRFDHKTNDTGLSECTDLRKGSRFHWKFDKWVVYPCELSLKTVEELSKQQALLNPGLEITVSDAQTGVEKKYRYDGGIKDLLIEAANGKSPEIYAEKRITIPESESDPNTREIEIAAAITDKGGVLAYHNYRKMTGGAAFDAVEESVGRTAEIMLVKPESILSRLAVAVHTRSRYTRWKNASRTAVNDYETGKVLQEFIDGFIADHCAELYDAAE